MKLPRLINFATIMHATGLTLLLVSIATLAGLTVYWLDIDPMNHPALLLMNIPIFSLTLFIGMKVSGVRLKMIAPAKNIPLSLNFWIAIITTGAIILISDITNLVYYFYPADPEILKLFDIIGKTNYGLIAAGLIAPITEELFFRGFLITGLLKNYSISTSVFISGLLFALIHENVWQMFPAFLMGIFLGWIFVITKNIWLCVGIHAFQNLVFTMLEAAGILVTGMIYPIEQGVQFQPLWLDLLGALLFIIGIHFIRTGKKI